MKRFSSLKIAAMMLAIAVFSLTIASCGKQADNQTQGDTAAMEKKLTDFIQKYEQVVKPATVKLYEAYFDASIVSNDENWAKVSNLEKDLNNMYFNKDDFNLLKEIKESNAVKDPLLARQLTILYNEYLSKQADQDKINKLTELTSKIELKYSSFRAKVGKKQYTDNQVEDVLKNSVNNDELKNVWLAQKEIGPLVAKDIIEIVKLRNEIARELGFSNYHEMSLTLSEQDPKEISALFDELDNLTKDAFVKVKAEIDGFLANRLKIKPEELMPWHYQNRFFQEAPQVFKVDFDKYYKNQDIVKLTEKYYAGIGLPIDDMVAKSDLFEKPNKNQHAYCINIDRDAKDIRVLCNVTNTSRWMETMLHEFGHALYEKHYAEGLPWILETPAHTFTTEAIAMMFGRKASEALWMQDMLGISDKEREEIAEIAHKRLQMQQLVFSRWAQVMYRFEKALYENPDQDLNKLWWDIVEKYQMIKRPENRNSPDWATKIHIATSPCYYHNYLLGELFASQLYYSIAEKVLKQDPAQIVSFAGKPEAGKYLIDKVFTVGAKYPWNEMIEKATGEKLTSKFYAKQFVN